MNNEYNKQQGGFHIHVYSSGNYFAETINNTFNAPIYYGQASSTQNTYSDEQIEKAIRAINGKGKPLNSKLKWAAVYWALKWYCNFPDDPKYFCERVRQLPLGELEYECDYDNIRKLCTLSFMKEDARHLENVKCSNLDKDFFNQCREVVIALVGELKKATPQIVQI